MERKPISKGRAAAEGGSLAVLIGYGLATFFPGLGNILTIESSDSLNVRAVYTAAVVDDQGVMEVQSIDVENVPERRLD